MQKLARAGGFEPPTNRLTADRSTTELRSSFPLNRRRISTRPATLCKRFSPFRRIYPMCPPFFRASCIRLCSRITQRNQSGNEVNESKESPVELFVTGGDSAELFELVEKAFHAIALLVNIQVVADYWKTRAEEADAKNCSRLGDTLRKPSESYRLDGEREAKSSPVPRYFQWVERMRTNWTNANNGQAVRLKASGVRQGKVSENFPKESYKNLFLYK